VAKIGLNIKFSRRVLDQIDAIVAEKKYSSKSEFIIEAVTLHLDKESRINEIIKFLKSAEGRELIKEIQKEESE
jgi:Arc/MetJ-type ribon-helix-helix transcriptional regulator